MSLTRPKFLSASALAHIAWRWGVLLLLMPLALAAPAKASDLLKQQAERLGTAEAPAVFDVPLFSGRLLAEFYAERDYRPVWDAGRARALLKLARHSRDDGFDPDDFLATAIARLIDSGKLNGALPERESETESLVESGPSPDSHPDAEARSDRAGADILLSDALLRYIHHFRFGKYNPRHINRDWIFVDKADADGLKADMALVLASPDLDTELSALLPSPSFYRNLKQGYRRYLDIADHGGWQEIPGGVNLNVGMRDPRVPLIRERLAVTDGLQRRASSDPHLYGEDLADAVKGFQQRSGLSQDAVIGPNTLRALNHPLDDRLLSIRANLERMRWLYNDLPADYLFVDVAAFRLHLVRDNEEVWSTPVVIGTPEDQTPMFRDEMEHLVFNPTWSVPVSIQKKMRGVSSRYKIVDRRTGREVSGVDTSNHKRYRLVQPAGPRNALGQVKFMFPNGHAIYLHDTPSKNLFARSSRAYSHGCVRVKEPLTLAQHLLNKPNWDRAQINRVVRRGSTRYVDLDEHLPVLLYYLTALADDQGRVGFRQDVYERDQRLFAVLDQPAHIDRIAFREAPIEAPVERRLQELPATAPDIRAPADSDAVTASTGDAPPVGSETGASTRDAATGQDLAPAAKASAGGSISASPAQAGWPRLILDAEGRFSAASSRDPRLAFELRSDLLTKSADRIAEGGNPAPPSRGVPDLRFYPPSGASTRIPAEEPAGLR